nr:MAG TPA: hypothetical protein [Caudoviricetes sp.]
MLETILLELNFFTRTLTAETAVLRPIFKT